MSEMRYPVRGLGALRPGIPDPAAVPIPVLVTKLPSTAIDTYFLFATNQFRNPRVSP